MKSCQLADFWHGPFLLLIVNFLSIHSNILGSADADAHFPSLNCYDPYANIGADNDLFPDFSGQDQHTDLPPQRAWKWVNGTRNSF
jgi:hypothetical protein